jgi:hypothetical protein
MLDILKKVIENQNSLYDMWGSKVKNFIAENESSEYYAHSYLLGTKNIKFRIAKKTPTKTGWFVTMWKRNPNGIIAPYESTDQLDLFVINIVDRNRIGQFVFPKLVLVDKNIFSTTEKVGKRAIRVYSPWDEANNTQALRTKKWQCEYFVDITSVNSETAQKLRGLYSV